MNKSYIELAKYQFKCLRPRMYSVIFWVLLKQICRNTFLKVKYYILYKGGDK